MGESEGEEEARDRRAQRSIGRNRKGTLKTGPPDLRVPTPHYDDTADWKRLKK